MDIIVICYKLLFQALKSIKFDLPGVVTEGVVSKVEVVVVTGGEVVVVTGGAVEVSFGEFITYQSV